MARLLYHILITLGSCDDSALCYMTTKDIKIRALRPLCRLKIYFLWKQSGHFLALADIGSDKNEALMFLCTFGSKSSV